MEKYGDERKTKVMKGGVKSISIEDTIPDEENVLVLTAGGYLKRASPSEYKKQKRGGVGVVDLNTKEEDFVTTFLTASTHSDLLFFTNRGKAYQMKMYEIPEGKRATKGKSILNFLSLTSDEKVTSVRAMPRTFWEGETSLLMVTKNGIAKKVAAESFRDVRRSGLIAIKLSKNDALVASLFAEKGDTVVLATKNGQSIRFKESDIREMGRSAAGVHAIKLDRGDVVIGASAVRKDNKRAELLAITASGYGKKTPLEEYKVQRRGGGGIKTAKVSSKTRELIAAYVLSDEEELIVISKKGQVIRLALKEIPSLGRSTQGVRIMKLRAGDSIAALICL
jgi:DNA gyrase subunit A